MAVIAPSARVRAAAETNVMPQASQVPDAARAKQASQVSRALKLDHHPSL